MRIGPQHRVYACFFLLALLGFVAEYLGIRNSYPVCLPVVVLGLLATRALSTRKQPEPPAGTQPEPATPLG